jgi:hypothetical protein
VPIVGIRGPPVSLRPSAAQAALGPLCLQLFSDDSGGASGGLRFDSRPPARKNGRKLGAFGRFSFLAGLFGSEDLFLQQFGEHLADVAGVRVAAADAD